MHRSKVWHGYTFSRLCIGVLNIQRRAAGRAETIGTDSAALDLIEWENEHTRCFLWTFRVSVDEFTSELTNRTSPDYARRFFEGYVAARLEERKSA